MTWLRIPRQRVSGLVKLLTLDEQYVDQLISILEKASPTYSGDDLIHFVASELGEGQPAPVEVIMLLLSLTALRLRLDLDPSRLASILWEAINESEHEELRIHKKQKKLFTQRLTRLLNMESLLYPTKGPSVVLAHEQVFTYARIITDIRPIFGADITVDPPAAAITHTLQLTCRCGDDLKDFYVAMDKDDLALLSAVLTRAMLKAENLRSVLKKTGMTTIWE